METRVLLTGSEGMVGRVLTGRAGGRDGLEARITGVDRVSSDSFSNGRFVRSDLSDTATVESLISVHDAVVHAAWDTREGILRPWVRLPGNLAGTLRLISAAVYVNEVSPLKLVLLSSVNAHVPRDWHERRRSGRLISPSETPRPHKHNPGAQPGPALTEYGTSKILIEQAARRAASNGLHVVVLRLGGVNVADLLPSRNPVFERVVADPALSKNLDLDWEDAVLLRHRDLVATVGRHVHGELSPGTFVIENAVSLSGLRVHEVPRTHSLRP